MNTKSAVRNMNRRTAVYATIVGVLAVLGVTPAAGQSTEFPARTVKIVLPLPPGTVNDTVLRLLADRLSKTWGQSVIVENKPGASTIIGSEAVAKAPADGYTLLANVSLLAQNQSLRKKLPYDAQRDLTAVTQLNRQQLVLLVRADFPAHSIAELVTYAEANPGKVSFGSWGLGSTAHLIAEKFRVDKGVQFTHVAYKGAAEIVRGMVAGDIDVGVADRLSPNAFVRSGRLRIIGVTGPARLASLPEVGTLGEAGITGFDDYNWFGLFAPAGTPSEIVDKIAADIRQVQTDPALAKRLMEDMFVTPTSMPPDEFRAAFRKEIANWASVAKATGVMLE